MPNNVTASIAFQTGMRHQLGMPCRDEHNELGMLAGGLTALVSSLSAPSPPTGWDLVARIVGGLVGGGFGSRLPDVFEPATSPHHRSTMHSAVVTTAISVGGVRRVIPAANAICERNATTDPGVNALQNFLAGMLVGTAAGYMSHTVADAFTPRGIPLLTRNF